MAQRYGGKFSPDGKSDDTPKGAGSSRKMATPFAGKRASRASGRTNFLFLAPLPLVFYAFGANAVGLASYLIAFGLLMGAAWLTREGMFAQEAYDSRSAARRPAIPRKIFGSALTGFGLGLATFTGSQSIIAAVIIALLGGVLHSMSFGIDPLKNKGMDGVDSFQSDRVAKAVDEAEQHLSDMSEAIARTRDRHLVARVAQFQQTARDMFRTVEEDPRDLSGARKYLGVYLLGAKDATVKFADLYTKTENEEARADYEALLSDLEKSFSARTEKMLLDDRSDLDVEIGVLRERLEREGIRAG